VIRLVARINGPAHTVQLKHERTGIHISVIDAAAPALAPKVVPAWIVLASARPFRQ
jgi:hypothetical protein